MWVEPTYSPRMVSWYQQRASQMGPTPEQPVSELATYAQAAPRLVPPTRDAEWPLLPVQAVHLALARNELLRADAEFLAPGNRVLAGVDQNPSIYDVGIGDTSVVLATRGLEAAFSDFDPRWTSSLIWGRDENVQNNAFLSGGLPAGATLQEDTAAFRSQLQKTFLSGGTLSFNTDVDYDYNNAPARLFPSAYTGVVGLQYQHPLWGGSGPEFTRIAGPVGQVNERITGLNQGIAVARINSEMSLADFELTVSRLVRDVWHVYWDLHLAWGAYAAEKASLDSIEPFRRKARAIRGFGGTAAEAQADETFYEAENRTEQALATLHATEGRLRRLLGLPVQDGRLIKPVLEPFKDEVHPDWTLALLNATSRRIELRRQKAGIRSLELQLVAARSLANPRLDFVGGYRVNGFGDDLVASGTNDGVTTGGYRNLAGSLERGSQTGWNLGLTMSLPVFLRAERSQVRNYELRIAKARANLAAAELEISHELAQAFQALQRWHAALVTTQRRASAARRRLDALLAALDTEVGDPTTLQSLFDQIVRAQTSGVQARIEHERAVAEYNKALVDLHDRQGTLLDRNAVSLAETCDDATLPMQHGPPDLTPPSPAITTPAPTDSSLAPVPDPLRPAPDTLPADWRPAVPTSAPHPQPASPKPASADDAN